MAWEPRVLSGLFLHFAAGGTDQDSHHIWVHDERRQVPYRLQGGVSCRVRSGLASAT